MLLSVLFSAGAQATPGDLDLTFSGDGRQTTDFRFGSSEAAATVRQPDGKIVVVGALSSSSRDFAIARYNSNGTLDTGFSGDGRQVTDFGQDDAATGVALQADGKIVVVGTALAIFPGTPTDDFAIARYNSNGTLDTSFSGDGKQTTDFGGIGGFDAGKGVAIQTNGKIIAVGRAGVANGDFGLARYNSNGTLDTSFSGNGKQVTDFGGSEEAHGVAVQSDGQIVAVGRAGGSDSDFALARYNPNGSLDTSFSGDGKQTTNFGFTDFANQVALQTDGRIVAVGFTGGSSGGGGGDFALARYLSNGTLDTTFSGDGIQTTDFSAADFDRDEATGVALQGDGKIVAVGPVEGGDFALARYLSNGSLDSSFSGDGKQTTDFGGGDEANGVAIQTDDKIVAVGGGGPGSDFAIARFNPTGTLDTSFSGDGKQTTSFNSFCCERATGVAIQADGKIVVVGRACPSYCDFALARYNPNGSLDTSFSGDGKQTTDLGAREEAHGVALQANGKIVVVGERLINAGGGFALARYNPNGSLDTTFSGDGKQMNDFGGIDRANGVAIQTGGKIVVVGEGGPYPNADFALARYNPDGSLDASFSGDGKQMTDFQGENDAANGVLLQADGKIVAVGKGSGSFGLARYNPNGTLDPSFSGDGKQMTSFGGFGAAGAALQADGKILTVGRAQTNGNYDFGLARYNPNGSLDASFSGDGKQTTDFGPFGFATAVALQADGKVVAVGEGLGTDGTEDFALARYLGG